MTTTSKRKRKAKPTKVVRVITVPNGRRVTLGQYVKAWKLVKTLDPDDELRDWDLFPTKASTVLRDISYGVNDRVNIRGGINTTPVKPDRIHRLAKKHLWDKRKCRYCGQTIPGYTCYVNKAVCEVCNEC